MRFGTYYFLQAPPALAHPEVVRREIEQMAWTEELGFDSIWLTEHHFIEYGLSVSPAVRAAAAAMRTRRVRIGLAAAILPFHDPVRLAEELAMVDILSGGRLDVGVGRGNRPVEFEGYRVPLIESRDRSEEARAILVRAWPLERFSKAGRHYTIPEVRVIPKPLQQPHPPLYVVCVSPDTIEATALRGLPMLNSLLRGPVDQLSQSRDTYVRACRKGGRTEAEIARLLGNWGVSRHVYVAPTDAEALAEAKDAELWYQEALRRFLIPEQIERVHPLLQPGFRAMAERLGKVTWDQLVAETVAFGSPGPGAAEVDGPKGPAWVTSKGAALGLMNGMGSAGREYIPSQIHRSDRMASTGLYEDGKRGIRRLTDPELRLRDQERDGVQAEVLYGILGTTRRLNDAEAAVEVMRIYNEWLGDFCDTHPDRYAGLASIPHQPAEAAVEEVKRVIKRGAVRGLDIANSLDMLPLWDPQWTPLWDVVNEARLPVHFHTVGGQMPDLTKLPPLLGLIARAVHIP